LNNLISLHHFEKFKSTTEAVDGAAALLESKIGKKLKKAIKKSIVKQSLEDDLAVADPKLGTKIKDKFDITCVSTNAVQELMSLIRNRVQDLIPEWSDEDEMVMQLGTSHGIGRYKLKFSPDKVDTMIVQAVSLLDDLDKELNNYIMRCREWYGWHFPELSKILPDHMTYVRTILTIGMRSAAADADLSDVIEDEETANKVKEYSEISMGTDIADEDLDNIKFLCQNIIELTEYRAQLYDYLRNRMMTIAPNLTILVGELVGARLISHAGSLMNLAKHPASTVQILGAEKALFRALKTKHDTPKYGLIYHAQLVGMSSTQTKGKMSRMLAAKAALATRVDALGDEPTNVLGTEHRAKLEARLKMLEDSKLRVVNGFGKKRAKSGERPVDHKSKKFKFEPKVEPKEE
jgi:nucleolar protein 58